MRYLINKHIWFRVDDGTLKSENNAVDIKLTRTTCRLLTYLLERQGEVATRNELLVNIWDANGLTSSNNSLNKYISDIRRIFSDIGFGQDVIMTVPKIGFMLTGCIEVEKHESTFMECNNNAQGNNKKLAASKTSTISGNIKCYSHKKIIITLMFLITLASFYSLSIFLKEGRHYEKKLLTITENNKCLIKTASREFLGNHSTDLMQINSILQQKKISCSPGEVVIIQFSDSYLKGMAGRLSVIKCRQNSNDTVSSCSNYYENNYSL